MAEVESYVALVKNIHVQNSKPAILPSHKIFVLWGEDKRVVLNPKTFKPVKATDKGAPPRYSVEEGDFLIRYVVYAVAKTKDELYTMAEPNQDKKQKTRGFTATKRQSHGPTSEPLSKYLLVEESEILKEQAALTQNAEDNFNKEEEDAIMKEFESHQNEGNPNLVTVNEDEEVDVEKKTKRKDKKKADRTDKDIIKDDKKEKKSKTRKDTKYKFEKGSKKDRKVKESETKKRSSHHKSGRKTEKKKDNDSFAPDITDAPVETPATPAESDAVVKTPATPAEEVKALGHEDVTNGCEMEVNDFARNVLLLKETNRKDDKDVLLVYAELETLRTKTIYLEKKVQKLESVNDRLVASNQSLANANEKLSNDLKIQLDKCLTKIGAAKTAAKCSLKELTNAVSEEPKIPATKDEVFIGKGKFIKKVDIAKVERAATLEKRVQGLAGLIFGSKVATYSLSGEGSTVMVTDQQIEAMMCLLDTMKWGVSETYDMQSVRRVIGKYTSRLRKALERSKPAPGGSGSKKARQRKSSVSSSGDDSSTQENENGKRKRRSRPEAETKRMRQKGSRSGSGKSSSRDSSSCCNKSSGSGGSGSEDDAGISDLNSSFNDITLAEDRTT